MELAVELSRLNVENATGGPFGAAVFNLDTHRLVAAGVNRVVPLSASLAHAEVMALTLAQDRLQTFDLSLPGRHGLYTSAQPCLMCLGAVLWSGVVRLVFGALGREDVEPLTGFDEGPLPPDWTGEFARRGIVVEGGLLRTQACQVLRLYARTAGPVYNPGRKA